MCRERIVAFMISLAQAFMPGKSSVMDFVFHALQGGMAAMGFGPLKRADDNAWGQRKPRHECLG